MRTDGGQFVVSEGEVNLKLSGKFGEASDGETMEIVIDLNAGT